MAEWRDVVGYEGLYSVNDMGDIFSHITNKILKHSITPTGYHTVELFRRDGSKSKRLLIHRLVATAFLPNPNNCPQINHLDENKSNNAVSNLEWCTAKQNMNYGEMAKIRHTLIDYGNQKRKEIARKNGRRVSRPVDQFDTNGNYISSFDSIRDAERAFGVSNSHIAECCKGKRYKTVYGFIWKYRKVE